MSIPNYVNKFLHPLMVKRVHRFYNRKLLTISRYRPELFKTVDALNTQKHLELWGRLGLPCSDKWLRMLSNISGIVDYRYCPDDIYYSVIERVLNDCDGITNILDDKNMLAKFVPADYRPKTVLRYMRGEFFDDAYNWISVKNAKELLFTDNGPLSAKKSVESLGGHDVYAFNYVNGQYCEKAGSRLTLDFISKQGSSFIVQERVRQCNFSAMFNPYSANTCRIISLRKPWDGTCRVVAAGMRFGVTEAAIDNMSSGGICVAMGPNGELSRFAVGNWCSGAPVDRHPVSGVSFGDKIHPYYKDMCKVACECHANIPNANLLSWDMVVDENKIVKILEVNAKSQGVDWPQFDFGALFGDDTEAVIDWCVEHKKNDKFAHFRTWF